jgi:hypothetical protein
MQLALYGRAENCSLHHGLASGARVAGAFFNGRALKRVKAGDGA